MARNSIHLLEKSTLLRDWLFKHAIPVWLEYGVDRKNGGFFECLSSSGIGLFETKRARVQPRQIYSFIEAGKLGWKNWEEPAIMGLEFFIKNYAKEDGSYVSTVSPEGRVIDESFNLYNQAFASLAFAHVASTIPHMRQEMTNHAAALLNLLRSKYSHPEIGFEEGNPRKLPLCSNPHMHLLEACLAWEDVSGYEPWGELADEIVDLCINRLVDKETGAMREYFNGKWQPADGNLGEMIDTGHQFEWAWLLTRWAISRGNSQVLSKAKRLFEIGLQYGIDSNRKVAVMSLNEDFSVRDSTARLWSQTEWIKAAVIMAQFAENEMEREACESQILSGIAALWKFLDFPVKGLWWDKLNSENQFVDESVPASSFYHIVCALSEFFSFMETRK